MPACHPFLQVQTEMMGDLHHYAWRARHRNQTVYIHQRDAERFGNWTSEQCSVRWHLSTVASAVHVLLCEACSVRGVATPEQLVVTLPQPQQLPHLDLAAVVELYAKLKAGSPSSGALPVSQLLCYSPGLHIC